MSGLVESHPQPTKCDEIGFTYFYAQKPFCKVLLCPFCSLQVFHLRHHQHRNKQNRMQSGVDYVQETA